MNLNELDPTTSDPNKTYSQEEIEKCIEVLSHLQNNPYSFVSLQEDIRFELLKAAGELSRPSREVEKKRNKASRKFKRQPEIQNERKARAATGIRLARDVSVFTAPLQIEDLSKANEEIPHLHSPRNCYVCKAEFTKLHHFYDTMCGSCADLNYKKRFQTADLRGQIALITGSRLKIGYQATLMMLRAGATVIATTRFPVDSAIRFSKESDFSQWGNRLHIYGLDLRHTPSIEIFCNHIEQTFNRLDILINNAAQTVRRPPGFYSHLMPNEMLPTHDLSKEVQTLLHNYHFCVNRLTHVTLPALETEGTIPVIWHGKQPGIGLKSSAALSQIPYTDECSLQSETVFPQGKLDLDLQQVDLRTTNSWRLKIGEIQTSEMIELQLINAIAPFVLCNKLTPLMKKDYTGQKHIVNVSAMEGKFMRWRKSERHPHTNMAKAALNMLTHTSAAELAESGIFMNAVDTGWVTDEDPAVLSKLKQDLHDFQPPLDIVDGAARVVDPIFDGVNTGKHWCGKFLKDYFPIEW